MKTNTRRYWIKECIKIRKEKDYQKKSSMAGWLSHYYIQPGVGVTCMSQKQWHQFRIDLNWALYGVNKYGFRQKRISLWERLKIVFSIGVK